ncbi:uncharacterized protein SPAPADRAFT_63218 [Spathaspora passalidarum NRRL Y-27907]|uniref:Alpha-1,6-mannosyltransferase n=1 Tax=Spathaspora passalidarum (strain NRRL Y-27907 / 11-Y1) TaxID=619300 RepID=G3ATZ0_SPAPN|nr:uncharacterized protein SPAPADRAFT_63218 [Spathaspora passalidarum NRRL Y-27907]EGW30366.1 hypothetical protein SPAPADRAFT_63218 [Spathaspora passalidarum NRRL Y-27907]
MAKYGSGRGIKRSWLIELVVLVVTGGFIVFTVSQSSKEISEVLPYIPNEKIFNFLSNENEKNQDLLLAKIEKLNRKLFQEQQARLDELEKQQRLLLKEIKSLKSPPAKASLRDKLVYLYPYDPQAKFPAYIWQTWKHGLNDERFDEKYRQGESQWAWKNPGFVHELFNDDTAHTMIRHLYKQIPEVIDAFESLPEVILRMDFFRYLILYAKGGVYADIDTFPLQPIPNWTPENVSPTDIGMIVAIDIDSSSPNWRQESARRLQFGQFVIQAKPGHPVLREVISEIVEQTQYKKTQLMENDKLKLTGSSNQKSLQISKWTGGALWTDVILKYLNDYIQSSIYQTITWQDFHDLEIPKLVSDILVLPIKSFASELEIPKDGKIQDPLAFVKHYSAKIWKTT